MLWRDTALLSAKLNDEEERDTIRENRRITCGQKLSFLKNATDDVKIIKKIKMNKMNKRKTV